MVSIRRTNSRKPGQGLGRVGGGGVHRAGLRMRRLRESGLRRRLLVGGGPLGKKPDH